MSLNWMGFISLISLKAIKTIGIMEAGILISLGKDKARLYKMVQIYIIKGTDLALKSVVKSQTHALHTYRAGSKSLRLHRKFGVLFSFLIFAIQKSALFLGLYLNKQHCDIAHVVCFVKKVKHYLLQCDTPMDLIQTCPKRKRGRTKYFLPLKFMWIFPRFDFSFKLLQRISFVIQFFW